MPIKFAKLQIILSIKSLYFGFIQNFPLSIFQQKNHQFNIFRELTLKYKFSKSLHKMHNFITKKCIKTTSPSSTSTSTSTPTKEEAKSSLNLTATITASITCPRTSRAPIPHTLQTAARALLSITAFALTFTAAQT